ncbi:MAG TPA: nucleoside-triphosphatase [Candidatus Lokiarchaeia archaeon]|nr:nucleoside-triphosphatase [Candidatus Lokiarchaeia archaeon]
MANILLTGLPGVGKTTIIKNFVARTSYSCTGFYTGEIRNESGQRTGFSITRIDGSMEETFASVDFSTKHRIGKYFVDVARFEQVALFTMVISNPDELIVIDEIGKMELLSNKFKEQLVKCLDGQRVLATITAKGGGTFVDNIKARSDVTIFELTRGNREAMVDWLSQEIQPPGSV